MSQNFWLIDLSDSQVLVSLVLSENDTTNVVAQGSQAEYSDNDSLSDAVDRSLSDAATKANLSENSEPSVAAFIVPPHWIGTDGKIVPPNIKLIETICHSLKFSPMGFIAHDEAMVEGFTTSGDLPPSFILLRIAPTNFDLTLIYLGKIQKRLRQEYSGLFSAMLLEKTLQEINSPSTLPPQVIIFGDVKAEVLLDLRNYPWVGRKDVETFLHLPDIRFLSPPEIVQIYANVISSQLGGLPAQPPPLEPVPSPPLPTPTVPPLSITEVPAEDLGFSSPASIISVPPPPPRPKAKITLPSVHLPHLVLPRVHFSRAPLLLAALLPLLVPLFYFLPSAKITLYINPYELKNEISIILDSSATAIDQSKNIIPVTKESFDVTVNESAPTTGEKTVGDKAKGEVTIFNKSDKIQSLPRATVLNDSSGKKFELINQVQVASSSADLTQGIITLGQARVTVVASDIGPEFNLPQGSDLGFKDFPSTILIAQAKESISGGSRRQIKAVSATDKNQLDVKITNSLKDSTAANVTKTIAGIVGAIKETVSVKQNRTEYNREVGEEADELTASAQSTISVLALDDSLRPQLVSLALSGQSGFDSSNPFLAQSNISFKIDQITTSSARGKLVVTSKSLPRLDANLVSRSIAGKSYRWSNDYLKTNISRLYNFSIKTNYKFLQSLLPLPFRSQNIHVEFLPNHP